MLNQIISFVIYILHLILVIFLLLSIIIKDNAYKHLALLILIFLLFHYVTNNNMCLLTELEYYFKKEKYHEGFLYRLIKPVLTTPEEYVNKYIYIIHLLWILILFFQLKNDNYFTTFFSYFFIHIK
jgi:hypothetical protein